MTDDIEYVTFAEAIDIAPIIIGPDWTLRDGGLLESALYRPSTIAFGTDAYPSLLEKAAALLHSLVTNHPFVDGNKRMGWGLTSIFCQYNGYVPVGDYAGDAYQLVMEVARGDLHDVESIAKRLGTLFPAG